MKVVNVVGARPNFMKIAPIMRAMHKYESIDTLLVHTGQHYDKNMSKIFFDDLNLPKPDIYLGVGSNSHAQQTAKIMVEFEKVVLSQRPDLVLVVGDVNSTIACALTAAKMNVPVAHVEAGLRSYDRTMPEEINRILTDSISDYLFTTCKDANVNLIREGIAKNKIYFVGNTMIDSLFYNKPKATESDILNRLSNGLKKGQEYALLTLHRPSNVDRADDFSQLISTLGNIATRIKILFPCHPRTKKQIDKLTVSKEILNRSNFFIIEPVGYLDFLKLMMNAKFVMTDSGGIQEETAVLGIPCLTLRKNTERPITVSVGTNVIVGTDPEKITKSVDEILNGRFKASRIPELWDGNAAERIVQVIAKKDQLVTCGV